MDPYAVLNVAEHSNLVQIKQAYKRSLLRNHPDTCKGAADYTIDQVNMAYRAILNAHNSSSTTSTSSLEVHFSDIKDLTEFEYNDEKEEFTRPCRCGQEMVLTIAELEGNGNADEIAVQCSGCSLWVLVQYEIENP